MLDQAAAPRSVGVYEDAIHAERHLRQLLKYSASIRHGFIAGCMAEYQLQRREHVKKEKAKPPVKFNTFVETCHL